MKTKTIALVLGFMTCTNICCAAEPTPAELANLKALKDKRDAAEQASEAAKQAFQQAEKTYNDYANKVGHKTETAFNEPGESDKLPALYEWADDYKLRVRRTLKDGDEGLLPALFQYTMPSNGEDSWLADIGVSLGHQFFNTMMEWNLNGEYHYNTAANALADTLLVGGGLRGLWGGTENVSAIWLFDASYKRDNLIAGEGALVALRVIPSFAKAKIGGFVYGTDRSWFRGRVDPFVGLEYETGNGASAEFTEGERLTARAGVTAVGYLLPGYFRDRIEFSTSLGYWGNLSTTGLYNAYESHQLYFTAAATYWFFSLNPRAPEDSQDKGIKKGELMKHFGLTARYANGDNPIEGAFDQDVWTFGFSVYF
jgi:hypothetical protein